MNHAYDSTSSSFSRIAGTLLCLFCFFLGALSASGQGSNFGWGRSYGGSGLDQGRSIQVENNGHTYVAGSFQDSVAFDSTAIVLHSQGSSDALLAKFNPSGQAVWALSIGGPGEELGLRLSLDKWGHLYLTGSFSSPSISLGTDTLVNSDSTGTDIFLAKYDTTGTLLWAKSMGAPGADMPTALGADGFGNSYLSGFFSAPSITLDTITLASIGGEDFFLAKHGPLGNLLWAVRSGSPLHDRSSALAVDSLGNCLLTGYFTGDSLFFASDTLTHADSLASPDIFLLKYNPQGLEEWAKSAGSDSTDLSTGIHLDADGYIYLTGKTNATELYFDSIKVQNNTTEALFLVRYNPAGDTEWETSATVTGTTSGWELAADLYGYMYLMADFSGILQLQNSTYQSSTGSRMVFAGYTIFSDYMSSKEATGTGTARGFGIGSDDYGSTFATGSFTDSLYFGADSLSVPVDSLALTHEDLFITKLDGYGQGGSGGGSGGGGGGAACQVIREVIKSCGVSGDEVLIRGLFGGKPSAVSFGGIPAQIIHKTFISVTAIVPAGYTGGPVAVTVNTCTDTAAFGLQPIVTASASAQGLCANTPLTLTATGATSYNWSSGQSGAVVTVSPSVPTAFTVTGSIGACSAKATVVVDVDTVLAGLMVQVPLQPVCAGSPVTLVAQGATSYSWGNGHQYDTLTLTPASSQTLTLIGSAGACTDTITVTLPVVPVPVVAVTPPSAVICLGDSITFTASGATTYSWWGASSDSSITVSPVTTTTYTVTGNTYACSDTATISVQVNPQAQLPTISGDSSLCAGETLLLTASGGATAYTWSGPGGFSSSLATISVPNTTAAHAGTYTVQPVGSTCQNAVATVQVQVNPVPVLTVTPQVQNILAGATAHITASGAVSYLWQPGSDTSSILSVAPTATTQYLVTGTIAGCSATDTATVIVAPLLLTTGPDQVLCGQTSTVLSATVSPVGTPGTWSVLSGLGGSFSDASSPTAAFSGQLGQHYLLQYQVNGASGPAATATMQVHFGAMPPLPVAAPVLVCHGSPATLAAGNSTLTLAWYQDLSQQPVHLGPSYTIPEVTSASVYYLTASNGTCKTEPVAVQVGLHPAPEVDAGADVTIVEGKQVRLQASGAATYSWLPAEGLSNLQTAAPLASPTSTTAYTVTGTSEHGCTASDWVTVNVLPLIQPANVFTPNGDGFNDSWEISDLTQNYPNCHVEIYNRSGNTVFSSKGYQTPWDGTSGGHNLLDGTYLYSIDPGDGHEPIKGMVVLMR